MIDGGEKSWRSFCENRARTPSHWSPRGRRGSSRRSLWLRRIIDCKQRYQMHHHSHHHHHPPTPPSPPTHTTIIITHPHYHHHSHHHHHSHRPQSDVSSSSSSHPGGVTAVLDHLWPRLSSENIVRRSNVVVGHGEGWEGVRVCVLSRSMSRCNFQSVLEHMMSDGRGCAWHETVTNKIVERIGHESDKANHHHQRHRRLDKHSCAYTGLATAFGRPSVWCG